MPHRDKHRNRHLKSNPKVPAKRNKIIPVSKAGFTMIELAATIAILAILIAIARPSYLKHRARSMQAEARLELTDIYTFMKGIKEQFRTFHMNFPDFGYSVRYVSQTAMSSSSNPYNQRLYAVSAGGPLNTAADEARPVTMASLGLSPTRPDPKNYAGWLAPNSGRCNITAADAYGATGGATPTATSTTFLLTAKGCPVRNLSSNFDVITMDEEARIVQVSDASDR